MRLFTHIAIIALISLHGFTAADRSSCRSTATAPPATDAATQSPATPSVTSGETPSLAPAPVQAYGPTPEYAPDATAQTPAPAGTSAASMPAPTPAATPAASTPAVAPEATPAASTSAPAPSPAPTPAVTPATNTSAPATAPASSSANGLCSLGAAGSYSSARTEFPTCSKAIDELSKQPLAVWYTDRGDNNVQALFKGCSAGQAPVIVVYGLPQKDCHGGYSSKGSNQNAADYAKWIGALAQEAGEKDVVYIMEPDAVGTSIGGECGSKLGYMDNLKAAMDTLGANKNARIYIDLGYWNLEKGNEKLPLTIAQIKELAGDKKNVKGIALNTSNFQPTSKIKELCKNVIDSPDMKALGLKCVVDTSRNGDPDAGKDWCNNKKAAIGELPRKLDGDDAFDYYLWVKPPGESDGTCEGGPEAGKFFKDAFVSMWNTGSLVKAGSAKI